MYCWVLVLLTVFFFVNVVNDVREVGMELGGIFF